MDHFKINGRIAYPVGTDMVGTVSVVNQMAAKLLECLNIYGHGIWKNKGVNLLVRGSSGAIIGGLLAAKLIEAGKMVAICHAKKANEKSHSNGVIPLRDYVNVIADDFICSGETVNSIAGHFGLGEVDILCVTHEIAPKRLHFQVKVGICESIWE